MLSECQGSANHAGQYNIKYHDRMIKRRQDDVAESIKQRIVNTLQTQMVQPHCSLQMTRKNYMQYIRSVA